ncbi:CBS domain-containing protein [Candidatus Bathyarchaeota archaeon]|nr:CBS domain-containing protein [Candidatus Bathyarchaeota archaeon]
MQVQGVMTKDLIKISSENTIENAALLMTRYGISSLIVDNDTQVVGILTERDVLTRVVACGINPGEIKVESVMTSDLITIDRGATVDEASQLMLKNRIKKLPITDPKTGKILGILSLTDIALVRPQLIKKMKVLESEEKNVHKLVKKPESQCLELKASLRYNSRRHCLDNDLEFNCLKTICAFLNADGGDLLIGVNDRNYVVGLKSDYGTFHKKNRDAFEDYLVNQISHKIGDRYLQFIDITFPRAYGHEICRVNVKPSTEPTFFNHKGRQYFYVRTGNGSRPFNIEDSVRYMIEKWPDLTCNDFTAQPATQPAS